MATIGNVTPNSGATNSSGSVSFSHTSNSTICEVWVGTADGGGGIQPTSVTVGGVSATKQSGATNTAQFAASQWVATGVASSGSVTVAISWSGSAQNAGYMAVARSIVGASGVGNVATPATSTANANPTITIATTSGRLVTAGAFNFAQQMSSGGGQTQDAYAGNLATFTVGSADHATASSSSQVFSWTQTSNPNAGWVATALDYIDAGISLSSQTATFSQGTFQANTPAAPITAAPLPPLLGNKALGPFGLAGFALRVFPQTAANPNVSAGIGAQTATFSQGTFSASSTGSAALGSQTATFSQGTFAGSSGATASIGAQTATFSQGTFISSGGALPSITCAGGTFDSLTPMPGLML